MAKSQKITHLELNTEFELESVTGTSDNDGHLEGYVLTNKFAGIVGRTVICRRPTFLSTTDRIYDGGPIRL